jgi:hypothetical protein
LVFGAPGEQKQRGEFGGCQRELGWEAKRKRISFHAAIINPFRSKCPLKIGLDPFKGAVQARQDAVLAEDFHEVQIEAESL